VENGQAAAHICRMMKRPYVRIDRTANAAYIYVAGPIEAGGIANSVEGAPGINLDFDSEGRLLGIELLSLEYLHPNSVQADDPQTP
jgi:Protein of unknown function (DUF2283)